MLEEDANKDRIRSLGSELTRRLFLVLQLAFVILLVVFWKLDSPLFVAVLLIWLLVIGGFVIHFVTDEQTRLKRLLSKTGEALRGQIVNIDGLTSVPSVIGDFEGYRWRLDLDEEYIFRGYTRRRFKITILRAKMDEISGRVRRIFGVWKETMNPDFSGLLRSLEPALDPLYRNPAVMELAIEQRLLRVVLHYRKATPNALSAAVRDGTAATKELDSMSRGVHQEQPELSILRKNLERQAKASRWGWIAGILIVALLLALRLFFRH